MRKLLCGLVAAVLMSALGLAARAQEADPPPIRAFDVETIESLGRAIHDQDRHAWVGTDALLAAVPRERLAGLIGWIVVEQDGATVVRFGQGEMDAPTPFYDVTFREGDELAVTEASGRFSETELAMFRAIALARQSIARPCSDRYNSVILPDPDGEGWLVWMLAATTQPNTVVFGGHYRITVASDGLSVERVDALSVGCLTMPTSPGDGSTPSGVGTTHIVSGSPIETHVFLSLSHHLPVFVSTHDRLWMVDGDEIEVVER